MIELDLVYALKQLMISNKKTVAVAESLTGGYLQYLMSSANGSSEFFLGGVTAYNIDQKVNLLTVDRTNAAQCDCVSEQTSIEMALGIQKLMVSDYSISTTGYSVPNDSVPIPYAHMTIYDSELNHYETFVIKNGKFRDREHSQLYFSNKAFTHFYDYIEKKYKK